MKTVLIVFFFIFSAKSYGQSVDAAIIGLVEAKWREFETRIDAKIKAMDSTIFYHDNSMIGKGTFEEPKKVNPIWLMSYLKSIQVVTSTQRSLLKPVEGKIIYNSTLNTWQIYSGGVWK